MRPDDSLIEQKHPSSGENRHSFAAFELELSPARQAELIAGLCKSAQFGAPCDRIRLLETHISYVLLTGTHAYKIKKATRLGFLDFTTLAARRFYCEEELRLNRRLAPELYLDVVAITGSPDLPTIGGSGPVLDYAVKMREFPQGSLLCNVLERDALTTDHVDQLAAIVAEFHRKIAAAPSDGLFGVPDQVLRLALANFAEIRPLIVDADERDELDRLETWTRSEHASCGETIAVRRRAGFVRECHGDLHLGNIALIDGALTIFDGIEFNDRMRWIDVMSEIAFTVMDLEFRGRPALAQRFLNAYLERTGDYGGVAVLRFYVVYRAMVRAKVAFLRTAQLQDGSARAALQRDYDDHVRLAVKYATNAQPAVVISHGFAGCGKTTLSQVLLEQRGAIRMRTDVERKRLHGLGAHANSRSLVGRALYAPEATRATYTHLLRLARIVVANGFTALIDGTFLYRWQRDLFRGLAAELQVPFVIVDIRAPEATLRARVRERSLASRDASEANVAVLEHQLRTHEPLGLDERACVVACDGNLAPTHACAGDVWRGITDRLGASALATVDAQHPTGEPLPASACRERPKD